MKKLIKISNRFILYLLKYADKNRKIERKYLFSAFSILTSD